MVKLKNKEVIEKPREFRLKFINSKKVAYPNELLVTDYQGWKVGDYLTKSTVIYEIINICRDIIPPDRIDFWEKRTLGTGRLKDLIKEYRKNGIFGACRVDIRPIIRGDKIVKKGKIKKFLELDECTPITYRNTFYSTNLDSEVKSSSYIRDNYIYRINNLERKRNLSINRMNTIQGLIDSKTCNPPIVEEEIAEYKCEKCGNKIENGNLHSCPYASEINSDYSDSCNCCENCEYNCAQEI